MLPAVCFGIFLVTLVCILFMFNHSLNQREHNSRVCLCLLALNIGFYLLGCILEMQSTTIETAELAIKVQYLGIPFISYSFMLLAMDVTNEKYLRKPLGVMVEVAGLLLAFLVFTNDVHQLFFINMELIKGHLGLSQLISVKQPLFYLIHITFIGSNIATIIILLKHYQSTSTYVRDHLVLISTACVLPLLGSILSILDYEIAGLSLTPLLFSLTYFAYWNGINRKGVFEIIPKAVDMALASMPDAFILLNNDLKLLHANEAAYKIFPGMSIITINQPVIDLSTWPLELHPPDNLEDREYLRSFSLELAEGVRHFEAKINKVSSSAGIAGWMLLIRDISDTIKLLGQLEELAFTDSLTGISNRRYFLDMAEREMVKHRRENSSLAIMMLDIDLFKRVNDAYGHQLGDVVLCRIVEAVGKLLRSFDLFARYGGEEFVLLITNVDHEVSRVIAERIRQAVEKLEISIDNCVIKVTISIGVTCITEVDIALDEAIKQADTALYQAKDAGRNQVVLFGIEK